MNAALQKVERPRIVLTLAKNVVALRYGDTLMSAIRQHDRPDPAIGLNRSTRTSLGVKRVFCVSPC